MKIMPLEFTEIHRFLTSCTR